MKDNFSKSNLTLFSSTTIQGVVGILGIAATSMLVLPEATAKQDIEIIGSDGVQVELPPDLDRETPADGSAPGTDDKRKAAPRVLGFGRGFGGGFGAIGGAGQGGGIAVIGPDGEPVLLSTEGARSVIINRSFTTVNENGQQRTKAGGKVIVVDADGQQREYELAESDNTKGLPKMDPSQKPEATKSYVIGVICQPVPEMLRTQLDLDSDTGLLVQSVSPGSPAAVAGLEKFDVLLYADDQQLASLTDLTTVVQETSSAEGSMMLTVVRAGKEIPVEITPAVRDVTAAPMQRMPMDVFEMNDLGPGMLFGGGDQGMGQMHEMMRRQMQQMKEEFRNLDGLIQEGLPIEQPKRRNIR